MLKLSTKADLERLIADEVQESLTLDYKASPALSNESKARDELCKDVSAFANSAGGQIVYGIEEKGKKPVRIDDGSKFTREWIEQVIDSNVQPRLESLLVTPIEITAGLNAYVLTIAQSTMRAPHQAPDKKYYKRQNFQSVAMEDLSSNVNSGAGLYSNKTLGDSFGRREATNMSSRTSAQSAVAARGKRAPAPKINCELQQA